jgi:spore coat protein U-like protein
MTGTAMAATATSNFNVSVTAAKKCTITVAATDVTFATDYDPTSASNNDSGTGSITFQCTKNTTYDAYITGTRQMTGAAYGDALNFELYTTNARDTAFPGASGSGLVTGTPLSKDTNNTINYYGRIASGQDVSAPDTYATATPLTFTVFY